MHTPRYCVYNTTRECFLSLGVTAADTPYTRLKGLIGKFVLRFDEGLWVVPSRGVHSIGLFFPLDLIYLDEFNHVIHMVESLPSFRIAPLRAQAASVLELPTHTIFSSQTQLGDRLVVCVGEEMEEHLQDKARADRYQQQTPFATNTEAAMTLKQKPSFIQRLKKFFASDRRSADRQPLTNLAAHFWTGAAPQKHEVRDISPTGLYLKTEERWYPGTVVTMTLQKEDRPENSTEGVITIKSKAVRTGNDGVGLAFVLPESNAEQNETQEMGTVANKKSLLHFLKQIHPSN